jgi:hypothetical protein
MQSCSLTMEGGSSARATMHASCAHQIHEDAAAHGALYGSVAPTTSVQEEEKFWWGSKYSVYSMHTNTHTHTYIHTHTHTTHTFVPTQ